MYKLLRSKFRELFTQLPYLPGALSLVWQAARTWTIAWAALLIVQGLLPVATVYLTRAVVDSLVASLDADGSWETLSLVLVWVGLMAAVMLLSEILRSLTNWIRTAQSELVSDYIHGLIHDQATNLDLAFYETPDYYDVLHRASVDAINKPVALLENLGSLVQNGISLIAMGAVLVSYSPWLPILLLLSTIPALWMVAFYTLRFNRWRMANTINERRTRYYNWILTLHNATAEVRLFELGDHYKGLFQNLRKKLRTERLQITKNQMLGEMAAGGLALLITGLTMAWMVWRAVQGLASLGDLALFFQAFSQGQRLMRTLLNSVGEIYRNIFFLENLFDFLNMEPQIVDPPDPIAAPARIQDGITCQDITFHYPGSQRIALDCFDLRIPAGQVVSIVGENGAGKSTLIKLLCRFYDPDSGRIRIDGTDLKDYSLTGWRRLVTVLFQQPVQYHDTAANNIVFGAINDQPDSGQIEAAARFAGAHAPISRLSKGYETVLGRWFGGADLSLGEWQRLSLARAFIRQASLIILDEPTSSMDSWAEADWLSRFRVLVAGRTALIITHRFTTAMQADIIHVMQDGRIVETGTHAELMNMEGRYAKSWRQQTQRPNA
ncbi:ABC transporter ATP-binding protein [Chloroflexota bacterium]